MNGWLNDTQNFSMMEAECQKIIITLLIYQGKFVSFGDYFFRRLFHLVFTKTNHEIIKEISGHKWSTTHSAQISQTQDEWDLNPQPRAYRACTCSNHWDIRSNNETWFVLILNISTFQNVSDKTKYDSPFPVPYLIKKFPARINVCCLQQIPLN